MKNLSLMLLIAGIIFSCSSNEPSNNVVSFRKLQLIETSGEFPSSTTTGLNMPWQEFYLLNADSTFTKTRTRNGDVQSPDGKYHYQNIDGAKYLKFVYTD